MTARLLCTELWCTCGFKEIDCLPACSKLHGVTCNERVAFIFTPKAHLTGINNTTHSVWHNLYLLLFFFQTLHVSIKPISIRCLFVQKLKTQSKNLNSAMSHKWYKTCKFKLQSTCNLSGVIYISHVLYHLWDLAKFTFLPWVLSFCINTHLMLIGLIETSSVWKKRIINTGCVRRNT
jgi:hypothetical protein